MTRISLEKAAREWIIRISGNFKDILKIIKKVDIIYMIVKINLYQYKTSYRGPYLPQGKNWVRYNVWNKKEGKRAKSYK